METAINHDELIDRLRRLDEDVSLLYGQDERLHCVIVGGSALILLNCITRVTHDIDVVKCSNEIKALLEKYDFNQRVQTYINNFPYDFEDRFQKIDLKTKVVDFYTASLEDVVIAKLHSFRDNDWIDVTDSEVLVKIDWRLLDRCAKEAVKSALNEKSHQDFILRYNDYVRRYAPCDN